MAMLKLCKCGKPIAIQDKRCEACQNVQDTRHKLYDKYARDKDSTAFYKSKDWILKRQEALLRDNGLCLHCLANKRMKPADMVDHIKPIKVDWSLRLRLSNLQSLCNPCHNRKTADDKTKY